MPEKSRLMPISYYNPKQEIRLSAYADTIVLESDGREQRLRAIRFGGYPEMVRAMSDAIYAGADVPDTGVAHVREHKVNLPVAPAERD